MPKDNPQSADKTGQDVDLFQLYAEDPDRADEVVFGRVPHADRRGFLKGAGLATMGALIGAAIPFHRNMPSGFIPEAMAAKQMAIEGKDGLRIVNDRPINAECPAHLLDDEVTPTARHFIRNNGNAPENVDVAKWTVTIDGEVEKPMKLSIAELKSKFPVVTSRLVVECAGNGRGFFNPPVKGGQWTVGAVGCAAWTGVRLADVLKAAGVKKSAVYTGHEGADTLLSGKPGLVLSRGAPIKKAMNPANLIAFAMNGKDLHIQNGHPLRLVIPGWPGSCSQKWLTRVWVRDKVHDGPKMGGSAYRMPGYTVAPGQKVPDKDYEILGSHRVKSLITAPETGLKLAKGDRTIDVRGHAWAGDDVVKAVHLSIDFGTTWIEANLQKPANPFAWQRFSQRIQLPAAGYYEVWARATDDKGRMQPFAMAWNPKGYLHNAMHRISVTVA